MIFEAKSFIKKFDSIVVILFISNNPPKIYFGPPIGGLGGSGAPLISPPNSHFIGGPESVKILGVQGILAV